MKKRAMASTDTPIPETISIAPLLKKLSAPPPQDNNVEAEEIALAFSRCFDNRLSNTQLASLLTLMRSTGKDRDPDVVALCAARMRAAANPIDFPKMLKSVNQRSRASGNYRGGLCEISGTGGDSHSTFNISTTSSIIASALLAMAKHGNRAVSSLSGAADVLSAIEPKAPKIEAVNNETISQVYDHTSYAFLLAPNFHPGAKYAAKIRKELGIPTIFNVLGPLANPVDHELEARLYGVAHQALGPIYARALQVFKGSKIMVVCGEEDLDEISCAGKTNCWYLKELPNPNHRGADHTEPRFITKLETFQLQPDDFGIPSHPLTAVGGGKLPKENAQILMSLLRNELGQDHPILHFVLINVAALLVVSGICDGDTCSTGDVIKERGPGGGRWKEGVRKARWCIESGKALEEFERYIDFTHSVS